MKFKCISPSFQIIIIYVFIVSLSVPSSQAQEISSIQLMDARVQRFEPADQGPQRFDFFGAGRLEFDAASLYSCPREMYDTVAQEAFATGVSPNLRHPLQVQRVDFTFTEFPVKQSFYPNGTIFRFGPDGVKFNEPALLTLPYDDFANEETQIAIYYYNRSTEQWEIQPTVAQDSLNKTITARIEHFSDYVVGSSPYVVDEAGSLDTGKRLGAYVDPYLGTLLINNVEFDIPARGLNLALKCEFNSDYIYEKYLPRFTGSEISAGQTLAMPGNHVSYSFPYADTKSGWHYDLPYCTFDSLVLGNGQMYSLNGCVQQWKTMADSSSKDYGPFKLFRRSNTLLQVLIPNAKVSVSLTFNALGVSSAVVYSSDGSRTEFPSPGVLKYQYDASGKNRLEYTFNGTILQKISHSDGRTVKILKYPNNDVGNTKSFVYLLSSSPEINSLCEGDHFIARRVIDASGRLLYAELLESNQFLSVPTNFELTADNESAYFRALNRTTYSYSLDSGVTNNAISITEPGNGFQKYIFAKSFSPYMVSKAQETKYRVVGPPGDKGEEWTTYFYYRYQNKPKVYQVISRINESDTTSSVERYSYNCSHASETVFTTNSYDYNKYDSIFGGKNYFPAVWNTSPSVSSIMSTRLVDGIEYYLTEERLTYAHSGASPFWTYCGIKQVDTLKHSGQSFPSGSQLEKIVRTFCMINDSYYPSTETVFRGGNAIAAWNIANTYDSFGRLIKKYDSRSGTRWMYYLYNGTARSVDFPYPYSSPVMQNLCTAFGVLGGLENEVAANVYHREYFQIDDDLNTTKSLRKELTPNETGDHFGVDAITEYAYSSETNNLVSVKLPNSDLLSVHYGTGWKSSFPIQESRVLSINPLQYLKTDFDYDIRGRLLSKRAYIADAHDNIVKDVRFPYSFREYSYDGASRVLSVTRREEDDSVILLRQNIYNDANRTILSTDARGYQTFTAYDNYFRPIDRYSFRPDIDSRTANYEGLGRIELSHKNYTYDPVHIASLQSESVYLAENDQDPLTLTYTYDTLGRQTKAERTRSGVKITNTETEYNDKTNEVLSRCYQNTTTFTATRVDKDWLDRPEVESVWTGTNQTGTQLNTLYAYDLGDRLAMKTHSNGEVYSFAYTSSGRLAKRIYPNGRGTEILTYDPNGRLQSSTDLNGNMVNFSYNSAGQVKRKIVSRNSALDETIDMTYCPYGLLTARKFKESSPIPELEYEYRYGSDGIVREESRTLWFDGTSYTSIISRELDVAGNLESRTVIGLSGFTQVSTYSAPGFGISIPGVTGVTTTVYDGSSKMLATVATMRQGRAALKYGNGQVTTYSFDTWLGLENMDQPGTAFDQNYSNDYAGNLTNWNNHNYAYDGLGRVASGDSVDYGYDSAGNLTTATGGEPRTFVFQLGSAGGNSMLIDSTIGAGIVDYSTDLEGNVVDANGRFGNISYDYSNRVTSIYDVGRAVTDSYAYDVFGIRYKKTEIVSGTPIQAYAVYSGNELVLEETFSEGAWETARIEIMIDGLNIGRKEKIFSDNQESIRYYYLNHQGSRIGVTEENGGILATITYDIWGNATVLSAPDYAAEREIRYTGKPLDATGLYFFNARYYDPQSRRFFTEDPIQQGTNWYIYCGNNPLNFTDPTGMMQTQDTFSKGDDSLQENIPTKEQALESVVEVVENLPEMGRIMRAASDPRAALKLGIEFVKFKIEDATGIEASAGLGILKDILDGAIPTDRDRHPAQVMKILEDGFKVLFRKDFGSKAHPIGGPSNGQGDVDHYNIEIQKPSGKPKEIIHIVPDGKGGFIWWGKDKVVKP